MKFLLSGLMFLLAGAFPTPAAQNRLSAEAAAALYAPGKITLYSLEPASQATTNDLTFHGYKILGQTVLEGRPATTAIAAFDAAVLKKERRTQPLCFEPRHALRVKTDGQTYDFLLCYACGYLYVYHNGALISELAAAGSPKDLNAILTSAKIPLSKSDQ